MALAGRELILAVTGSIAAYKAAHLLRELRRAEVSVTVVMTARAREFVAPLTFRTLSGRPVLTDLFDPQEPAVAALTKRIKEGFDPAGILNPGRMWAGV